MKISIAERLRPFSHLPGTYCLLPRTSLRFHIFPTCIQIDSLASASPQSIGHVNLHLTGPVEDFTVQQDLEKGEIKVWGHAIEGYFEYHIFIENDSIQIIQTRGFELKFSPSFDCQSETNKITFNCPDQVNQASSLERLSLGNHKAQDWDLVKRRANFTEIFPHWFRLASLLPSLNLNEDQTPSLLLNCENAVHQHPPEKILEAFYPLFAAGLEGILSPRSLDSEHQGFKLPPVSANISPLQILTKGAQFIRSLFLKVEQNTLSLLPALPPEFHSGRAVQWHCEGIGKLHFEWSKKTLRRVILHANATQTLHFSLQSELKRMRLRTFHAEKGTFISSHAPLDVQQDQLYLFDNFQR